MANWALVIGINNYSRLQRLKYAQQDAALIQQFFKEKLRFQQVFYFSHGSEDIHAPDGSIYVTEPTYGNIWSFLTDFFETPHMSAGDNFWFFFSGHGIHYQGRDYLMPSDGNYRAVENTAIALSYVTERLRRFGADNVVLLVDACRNEGDKAGLGVGLEKHQGVVTFFSCKAKEKSWEIEELKQGAFTHVLLEALQIQGEGNCATVERLEQYLRVRVPELNSQHGYEEQNPYASAEPATKLHLILLPKQATLADIDKLKKDAYKAEVEKNYELARQLWTRVNIAASGADVEVYQAWDRLPKPPVQPVVIASPTPATSGDKSPEIKPSPPPKPEPSPDTLDSEVGVDHNFTEEVSVDHPGSIEQTPPLVSPIHSEILPPIEPTRPQPAHTELNAQSEPTELLPQKGVGYTIPRDFNWHRLWPRSSIIFIFGGICVVVGVTVAFPPVRHCLHLDNGNCPILGTSSPSPSPSADNLSSNVGVSYTQLRDFLKAGKWKEADEETAKVMLKASKREKEGYLDFNAIQKFSCPDLRTIDQLWVKYSNRRFGFSVQKRIFQEVGGTPGEFGSEFQRIWDKFGDRVAWRVNENWLPYTQLTFDAKAPEDAKAPDTSRGRGG